MRDERLSRLIRDGCINIFKPQEEYFNIMLVHQNRVARGQTKYLQDRDVPKGMNLIIWGHEHDCIPTPVMIRDNCYVLQPGNHQYLENEMISFLLSR